LGERVEIRKLIWDPWNVQHIARHDVRPQEVEEVCHNRYIVRNAKYGRLMLIGVTDLGRTLVVVLAREDEDVYYPITARPADRKERRIYSEEVGETP
jgi:uncharacterized DUF497 family protein